MTGAAPRALALIGPGRAGTTIALAMAESGYEVVAVAGRAPDAASTRDASLALDAPAVLVSHAGRGAAIVVIATPDAAIESTVRTVLPSLEPGALVLHLAGSRGLDVFAELQVQRPDVRVGAMHPLQSFPSVIAGLDHLPGSWAAVNGDDETWEIAEAIGLHPFALPDDQRGRYHTAAVVASNHLVALLGQVERLAAACGVPFEAFAPLAAASLEHAFALGPETALTGPVARGDHATIQRHLAELAPGERDAYRALAREAAKLTGTRATALDRLLADMRSVQPPLGADDDEDRDDS